jgi:hypothetical protein
MIERVIHNKCELALIIRHEFSKEGAHFFTPGEYSQQLGYMRYPKDHSIPPHTHNIVKREVLYTLEVLLIKSGKVRVDLYTAEKEYVESVVLLKGDVILLAAGGHGVEILEDSEIIEVKQGPFLGDMDKVRFESVESSKIIGK